MAFLHTWVMILTVNVVKVKFSNFCLLKLLIKTSGLQVMPKTKFWDRVHIFPKSKLGVKSRGYMYKFTISAVSSRLKTVFVGLITAQNWTRIRSSLFLILISQLSRFIHNRLNISQVDECMVYLKKVANMYAQLKGCGNVFHSVNIMNSND